MNNETEAQPIPGAETERLSPRHLDRLDPSVATPKYDRERHGTGIVHIGVGAFHRAHQAVYTDEALALHGGDWRITGVALRSGRAAEQLNPQDGLYAVLSRSDERSDLRVVGALDRVIGAAQGSRPAIDAMADAGTRIVSLTITEKGYYRDGATGDLDAGHPDIVADLEHPETPGTAVGCIAEALRRRFREGREPFSILSCDNLPDNGRAVRQVVLSYAGLRDPALARWIEDAATFPSTMVDRICPATTEADRVEARARLGVEDQGLVVAEPFRQWVIEDAFCNGRPGWEDAGALLVTDVGPHERAKLRLLNGSHSAIAYFGCLAGIENVHEAIADAEVEAYVRVLMREARATLQAPAGMDLEEYGERILQRFRNSAIAYRNAQVAMDGSQKLPQRLIAPAKERLRAGRPADALLTAVALWIAYVTGADADGRRRSLNDPMAETLAGLPTLSKANLAGTVQAALGLRSIFDPELAERPDVTRGLENALAAILDHGPARALRQALAAAGNPG